MATPLIGAAGAYRSMYLSQVRPPGNMTTGATSTQSSSGQNIKPNQNGGKVEGAGTAPTGYTQDVNGRWHRPNGQFASNSEISSSWGNPNGWIKPDGSMNYPPNNGAVLGTEKTVTLQPGQSLGRYGTIGPNSNFTTAPGAAPNSLALPPNTSPSVYTEINVIKPLPGVTQSTIAEWPIGSGTGGGIQYQLPKPITILRTEGYISY